MLLQTLPRQRFILLLTGIVLSLATTAPFALAQYSPGEYGYYFDQGSTLFNNGRVSEAIEMFKKAIPLAGDDNLPTIYNNLAAAYIKRGLYFQNTAKNMNAALADYRNALFYLEYAWPEGIAKRPIHARNFDVTQKNLSGAYLQLHFNTQDKTMHLTQARALRAKGSLQEAIVEYGQTLKLDSKDAESAKALGELFNIVNMPSKSEKYFQAAGNALGDKASDDLILQQANAAYKNGNVDQAVKLYNRALEINPQNTTAMDQLEKVWLNEIKFNNASVLGHANLGSVYQKKKMYEQALQQYNAAEHFAEMNHTTPFDVKKLIRLNLGTLYQEKQQFQLAAAAYDTVLQSDPNNVLALTYKASLMKEVGKPEESLNIYQKILTVDPNNVTAQQALFSLATQQSDPAKQATGLQDYANRFPQNADIQSKVGEEFHRIKDYDNAAIYYQRAIQLNPNMAAAFANLGAVYQAQGKTQESLDTYRQALRLDPSNKTVKDLLAQTESSIGAENFNKAVTLQQQGKHVDALPYFRKALEQSPNNADLIAAYGVSLQNANQGDEAIRQYQKAIQLNPNDADYLYYLGTVYHQKNQLPLAVQNYKKAIQLNPNLKDAKSALASIEQQESGAALQRAIDAYNGKRYPQALVAVNEALTKNPNDAIAYYYKGLTFQAQNNTFGAKTSFQQATTLKPDFADAHYALAVILDTQKDKIGAQKAFKRFVELSADKNDEFVQYAQERLKALSTP